MATTETNHNSIRWWQPDIIFQPVMEALQHFLELHPQEQQLQLLEVQKWMFWKKKTYFDDFKNEIQISWEIPLWFEKSNSKPPFLKIVQSIFCVKMKSHEMAVIFLCPLTPTQKRNPNYYFEFFLIFLLCTIMMHL